MDVYAALEEVEQWCARATAAGDPEKFEVECHADLWITIGESAPPWSVHATDIAPLLDQIADDRDGRYEGLPPGFAWR